MYYIVSNELYHHGIKGQKWGVRKYQNPDGSLTPAGAKRYTPDGRYGKAYKKQIVKYQKDRDAVRQKLYTDAYNKTANEYNSHKIAEYNKEHKPTDSNYQEEYAKQFRKDWMQNYNKSVIEFTQNNKNYKKADAIAKKYGLYSVNDMAKKNKAWLEDMIKFDGAIDITNHEVMKKYLPENS